MISHQKEAVDGIGMTTEVCTPACGVALDVCSVTPAVGSFILGYKSWTSTRDMPRKPSEIHM